jgi:hypothetical protein
LAAVVLLIAMLSSIILTTRLILVDGESKPEAASITKTEEKIKTDLKSVERGPLIDFMEQRELEEKHF